MKALVDWILKEKLGIEKACEKPNIHIGFSRELLLEKLFYPSGWIVDSMTFKYRRKITITEQSGSDLTDHQVLIELNSTNFDFSHAQTNGEDIRFTDGGGNLLDYWIEKFDPVAEEAKIWVKVPSIPANGTAEIFMYYGNSEITDVSDASATFIRVIDGLEASWHFDEGSGTTAYDSSGNDRDGTIYGATWIDGKFGKALNFDGTDDYVSDGSNINVNALSVECWVNPAEWNYYDRIVQRANGDGKGFALRISPYNSFMFQVKQYSTDFNIKYTSGLAANTWYHVVGTWDGNTANQPKIYVNADEGADTFTDNAGDGGGTILEIGRRANAAQNYFNGIIDEVRIYNRALTPEEVSDLYNNYGYTTTNYPGKVLVRKYTEPEPSVSIGAEETA